MAYSTNAISGEVLDALFNEVLTLAIYNGRKMGNTWVTRAGFEVFYETTRNDQPDGGLCGSVFSVRGGRKGSLKIDGKGRILRFPFTTKEERSRAQSIGLANFIRRFGEAQANRENLAEVLA